MKDMKDGKFWAVAIVRNGSLAELGLPMWEYRETAEETAKKAQEAEAARLASQKRQEEEQAKWSAWYNSQFK